MNQSTIARPKMIALSEISQFNGSISQEEAKMLASLASQAEGNAIVEIGSWQGKSAIALAIGANHKPNPVSTVYCIDPHTPFKGVYGGNFGPHDRAKFYETMLRAGCAEHVSLINLSSQQAAANWNEPIGLLFIDGDHTESAVQSDADAWLPHLVAGGHVVFDDATDPAVGPYHVVRRLEAGGHFEKMVRVGKTVILKKKSTSIPTIKPDYRDTSAATIDSTGCTNHYLTLLERTILNEINQENGARIKYLLDLLTDKNVERKNRNELVKTLVTLHIENSDVKKSLEDRYKPKNWWTKTLSFPFSMIGPERLRNVRELSQRVIKQGTNGVFVETGVWRGGACMLMKGTMKALGDDRPLYVCDSFEGLPEINDGPDSALQLNDNPILTAPLNDVMSHFQRLDLLDDNVHFVKGWFKDTMQSVKNDIGTKGIALLRLDGDYYSSTMDVLVALYPLMQPGGYLIVDDYHAYEQCQQAIEEYRNAHSIHSPIFEIDNVGVYWQV